MSVKFRIGFDITGETVFAMIAKMLPIENLSVMELPPTVPSRLSTPTPRLHGPKPQRHKRPLTGPNLKKGINGIIMTELREGPKRASHFEPRIIAGGWSRNSINSRLEALRGFGVIINENGLWRLVKHDE
jgi:hypothetical protein